MAEIGFKTEGRAACTAETAIALRSLAWQPWQLDALVEPTIWGSKRRELRHDMAMCGLCFLQ